MGGSSSKIEEIKSKIHELTEELKSTKKYKLGYQIIHDNVTQKIRVLGLPMNVDKKSYSLYYIFRKINMEPGIPHVYLCSATKTLIKPYAHRKCGGLEYLDIEGSPTTEDSLIEYIVLNNLKVDKLKSKIKELKYELAELV